MAAPLIVKTVSRMHPGKAAEYRPLVEEICHLAERRRATSTGLPHLRHRRRIVGSGRPDPPRRRVDAASPAGVGREGARRPAKSTDFENLRIYGELNDGMRQWLPDVTEGITFSHHSTHWGGFTRLRGATT